MIFRKLFLIFATILLMSIGVSSVSAECYNICYDDQCFISEIHMIRDNEESKLSKLSNCLRNNPSNTDFCYDNIEFKPIDDSLCSGNIIQYNEDGVVSCGMLLLTDIPVIIPKIVHTFYLIALIAVPILLVIFGSIDFVKSLVGQKDDEIKKGRQIFIKRLITGVLVFFILSIVRLIVSIADDDSSNGVFRVLDCVNCFIENDC